MVGYFNQDGQERAVGGEDISAETRSGRVSFECSPVSFREAVLLASEKHEKRGEGFGGAR